MDYSLFEQILIIFGGKKNEEINADLIPLFNDFLNLDPQKKENIITLFLISRTQLLTKTQT